jgi:hypothetical protein
VVLEECLRVSSDPNEFLRMVGEPPMGEEALGSVARNDAKMSGARR